MCGCVGVIFECVGVCVGCGVCVEVMRMWMMIGDF